MMLWDAMGMEASLLIRTGFLQTFPLVIMFTQEIFM